MKPFIYALLLVGGTAFAGTGSSSTKTKAAPPPQTHHCVAKDGTPQPTLTHRECTKAGAAWKRDTAKAPAPAAAPAPEKPADAPAASPPPPPPPK